MTFTVDKELCIGCGACIGTCPEVFDMDDDDKSHVIMNPVTDEYKDSALEAEDNCPVEAISHTS